MGADVAGLDPAVGHAVLHLQQDLRVSPNQR
jgi:hypothetical protein